MFFGKNQTGFMAQQPTVNMVNQYGTMTGAPSTGMPYEGCGLEQVSQDGMFLNQHPIGYICDPCYCDPCCELTEIEKPQPQVYVVQKGDTVYKIAKKFGLDWRELAGYNHLGNPDLIYPGERLFIPPRY